MKKITVWALLLALTVALFAGCSNTAPAETEAPATEAPVSGLADAVAYVKTIYKNAAEVTAKDYQVISVVPMGEEKYEITWSVDVAEDVVAIVTGEDGMTTIDVNENSSEEVTYVLTATLTDGTETESLSWTHVLPAAMNVDGMTYAEIVDMAYALADGVATEDTFRLFGTVTAIDTPWSENYKNITVTIAVAGCEDKPIMCYRLQGEGAADLKVGDAITVEGILKNYKGTIEFDAKCELIGYGEFVDQKALLKAAFALGEGASLDYPAVMTGVISAIDTPWSEDYKNITVTIVVAGLEDYKIMCYRLSGEGAADLAVGDTITVTGTLKNYKNTIEFDQGCTLVSIG